MIAAASSALASSSLESTFRDPAGSLTLTRGHALRTVAPAHAQETLDFLATPLASALTAERKLVASTVVANTAAGLELAHPRVPFISYPSEWPPSLWSAAAALTLDLSTRLLEQDWILKDATPLNVLFSGPRPVFVDVLSIRRTDLSQPVWFAYGQFIRTFLLPLLAHAQLGWRLQTAQTWRDGIEPEELYAALSWPRRLRFPARTFITLPVLLTRMMKSDPAALPKRPAADPDTTRRTLLKLVNGLRHALAKLTPRHRASAWSAYATSAGHYSGEDHAEKRQFVSDALAVCTPASVLDIGANTGVYSRLAAAAGARVIAIDQDPQALEQLHAQALRDNHDILPLSVDLSFPTPATGWNNRESFSFLERCDGHFDTVLMLAVIHHLLLSSQIPLDRIAQLAARITTRNLIIEWVPPTDTKFIEVLRGREAIYPHLTEQAFRAAFAPLFTVGRETTLANGRILLHMTKR